MTKIRQVVGKRKQVSHTQKRGAERRQLLIESAKKLMETESLQSISFTKICKLASVPESSAYNFYANKYDLFIDVASSFGDHFYIAHSAPIERSSVREWVDLVQISVRRGVAIYNAFPIICELLIGSMVPKEIKMVDTENDKKIGQAIAEHFNQHFILPTVDGFEDKLFNCIQLEDALFSVSYREHRKITDEIVEEAVRATRGYLATYLPPILPRR